VQRPHAIFERQGDDLHCTVTIPMVAAALGATLSVESLDGPADIDIRPGTQSGQVIPLYGQGVRHLNGNGRGDLVIHVTVETPSKLDADQEKLLRDLAKLRGEEAPPGRFAPGTQGFFSRLRDAFNGRCPMGARCRSRPFSWPAGPSSSGMSSSCPEPKAGTRRPSAGCAPANGSTWVTARAWSPSAWSPLTPVTGSNWP
jgi:hypothetical protein